MSRKGENIYKRKDKRWEGRYIASYSAEGKAKYKSVYGHSYTEVRIKMQSRTQRISTANIISVTFVEWMEMYLKADEAKLKMSTQKLYERYLNNYIKPFFGNIALRKMNTDILQEFVNSLSELAPSTIKGVFSFLRETLKKANKENLISSIWLNVELPKLEKHTTEVFTRDEQKRIENAIHLEENPNGIGVLVCLYAGLRIGEVCGLKWQDIDFEDGTITVNRTIQRMTVDGKSILTEMTPKSSTSKRKIPIPSLLLNKLSEVKKNSEFSYVLSTKSHIMDPRVFQYQYKKLLKNAGVRYSNFHTLRHTFSVRALELGFDIKTLSEILGHADAAVTLKTYAHSLDEHKRSSMSRFDSMTA